MFLIFSQDTFDDPRFDLDSTREKHVSSKDRSERYERDRWEKERPPRPDSRDSRASRDSVKEERYVSGFVKVFLLDNLFLAATIVLFYTQCFVNYPDIFCRLNVERHDAQSIQPERERKSTSSREEKKEKTVTLDWGDTPYPIEPKSNHFTLIFFSPPCFSVSVYDGIGVLLSI